MKIKIFAKFFLINKGVKNDVNFEWKFGIINANLILKPMRNSNTELKFYLNDNLQI
jgi:hypothetical protein